MKELNRIKFFHLTCMLDLCLFFLFQYSRVEEKSVIKIFYDNAWGWKLISELSALRVKNKVCKLRKPISKLTHFVCFTECVKITGKD